MAHTLPEVVGDAARSLAIGAAVGDVLLSQLGEHGQPDVLCVGPANEEAAHNQVALDGEQTGITDALLELLPDHIAAAFTWDPACGCHVADGLTANRLERLEEGSRLDNRPPPGSIEPLSPAPTGRSRRRDTSRRPYHP